MEILPKVASAALLDDPTLRRALDPRDMMGLTTRFPAQCREAVQIGLESLPERADIRHVVVTGMGGSAIGGDMLASLMAPQSAVPVLVRRDYGLPAFVGPETLVMAVSYSGSTEETLSGYEEARRQGAQIVCITSGGELARRADRDGVPVIRIPGGQPPRASTAYLFFPMLAVAVFCGLLPASDDSTEAISLVEALADEYGPQVPAASNPAKQVAARIHGTLPVVYGRQGHCSVAALRWKTQLNENAKQHAFANSLPEQNHNEILAWTLSSRQAGAWSIVALRDAADERQVPQIGRRMEIMREIIGPSADFIQVRARGKSLLARLLSLIYLGDFVSVYAALLNGMDPTEIAGIDRLKAELAAAR